MGEAGAIAKRYFESLIANGGSPEQAFLAAENIKKVCDNLNSQQLTAVQDKINAMNVNTMDIPEFFAWEIGTTDRLEPNYTISKQTVIYSDFTRFVQANRGNADAEALAGLLVTIASTVVTAYQVYQIYKAVSASINAYRAQQAFTKDMQGSLMWGDGSNYDTNSKFYFKMDLQLFAKKDLKMVDDDAHEIGVDRNIFGEYIHDMKDFYGMKPSDNFTYQELLELARGLKGNNRK